MPNTKIKNPDSSVSASCGKRKQTEPTGETVVKKPKYTAKEERAFLAKKKNARAAKKPPAPRQEIMHRVWADAPSGIDQKEIDEQKAQKQCTPCTLTNHGWKHCKMEIRASTIHWRSFNLSLERSKPGHPQPRKLRIAAVADNSQGESSRQASQRPLVWTYMEDDDR